MRTKKAKMNGTKSPFSSWISWRNIPTTQRAFERIYASFLLFAWDLQRGNMGVMAENKPKEKPCNKRTTTLLTESLNRQETKIKFFFQEQIHKKRETITGVWIATTLDLSPCVSLVTQAVVCFLSREHSIVKQGPTIQARAKNFWDCHDAHNVTMSCHKLWA